MPLKAQHPVCKPLVASEYSSMKQFTRDYGTVTFFLLLLFIIGTAGTRIFPDLQPELIDLLLALLILAKIFIVLLLISRLFSVTVKPDGLIFKYFIKEPISIKDEQVKGLIYKLNYDSRSWYSRKNLIIKTNDGRSFVIQKWGFFNPVGLEEELRKKYKVLVPATETEISVEALAHLDNEIYLLDNKALNRSFLVSLIMGTAILGLSILMLKYSGTDLKQSIPIGLLGAYFLYTCGKNLLLKKIMKACHQQWQKSNAG